MKHTLSLKKRCAQPQGEAARKQRIYEGFCARFVSTMALPTPLSPQVERDVARALYSFWERNVWLCHANSRGAHNAWQATVEATILPRLRQALGTTWQPDAEGLALLTSYGQLSPRQWQSWEAFQGRALPPQPTTAERMMGFQLWRCQTDRKCDMRAYSVRGKRYAAQARRVRQLLLALAQIPDDDLRLAVGTAAQQWLCQPSSARQRQVKLQHPQPLVDFLTQLLPVWRQLQTSQCAPFRPLSFWLDIMSWRGFALARSPQGFVPEPEGSPIDLQLAQFCFFSRQVPEWLLREYALKRYPGRLYSTWLPWLVAGKDLRQVPQSYGLPFTQRMVNYFFREGQLVRECIDFHGSDVQVLCYLSLRQMGSSSAYAHQISHQTAPIHLRLDVLRFLAKTEGAWQPQELPELLAYLSVCICHETPERPLRLKGRTAQSMRRILQAQRQAYATQRQLSILPSKWPEQGYGWTWQAPRGTAYQVVELTSQSALKEEGDRLSHCVGGYAGSCAMGTSYICSLRQQIGGGWRSLITLEVNAYRHLVQAKGRRNRPPTTQEYEVILAWAEARGVSVRSF